MITYSMYRERLRDSLQSLDQAAEYLAHNDGMPITCWVHSQPALVIWVSKLKPQKIGPQSLLIPTFASLGFCLSAAFTWTHFMPRPNPAYPSPFKGKIFHFEDFLFFSFQPLNLPETYQRQAPTLLATGAWQCGVSRCGDGLAFLDDLGPLAKNWRTREQVRLWFLGKC